MEKVKKTTEEVFNTLSCKSPELKPRTRVSLQKSKGKGIKISKPNTEDKREKISALIRKGKEKSSEVKMEINGDSDEEQGLPWEGMSIRETEFAEGGKCHDMFYEEDDGRFHLFNIYEDYEEDYDDDGPDIPLSPCRYGEKLDSNYHAFGLLLRK